MTKTLADYVAWWIPIRKLRDALRDNSVSTYLVEIDHFFRYLKYKDSVNGKPTFFVRNDWVRSSLDFHENGWYRRIKDNFLQELEISWKNPDIVVFSPMGSRKVVRRSKAKIKIFFTGECVGKETMHKPWSEYEDNCINEVDLSLGFHRLNEDKNYVRFPLWILYHFGFVLDPQATKDMVSNRVKEINDARFEKTKFASLLARHDSTAKIRSEIYNAVSNISKISCPGKFLHNDDSLKLEYYDNKHEYLKKFKFNICPENTVSEGYVTEKLFDAFAAGCIPIYSGCADIEEGIVNRDAILFWEIGKDNTEVLKKIEYLNSDENLYNSFLNKPRLQDYAVDYIWERRIKMFNILERLISERLS